MALTKVSTDGVKDDAITKAKIPADQIEASELADNAVDTNAIADDAITTAKIATSAITNTEIATGTISASRIVSGGLTAATLANDAITTDKVADNAITQAKINVPITNRNLIINGAMQVAQRGTSSTSTSYQTVDRWAVVQSVQNAVTQAQVDVASGTTPYSLGFRKALKVTNGDQSSGATAGSILYIRQLLEAQDIAQSGWNYTSSSSFITLSFWIKSSVAQSFHGHLRSRDGTSQRYPFQTGALTANTWTKITKTISGNSNLQFDNNNDKGLDVTIIPYMGTTYSSSSATFDQWQAETSANFAGTDMTTTWFTTNDATLEITGVQLEVGSVATDFEHRSFSQEIQLCYRYYYHIKDSQLFGGRAATGGTRAKWTMMTPVPLRASPTIDTSPFGDTWNATGYKYNGTSTSTTVPTVNEYLQNSCHICFSQLGHSLDDDRNFTWQANVDLALDAEL